MTISSGLTSSTPEGHFRKYVGVILNIPEVWYIFLVCPSAWWSIAVMSSIVLLLLCSSIGPCGLAVPVKQILSFRHVDGKNEWLIFKMDLLPCSCYQIRRRDRLRSGSSGGDTRLWGEIGQRGGEREAINSNQTQTTRTEVRRRWIKVVS